MGSQPDTQETTSTTEPPEYVKPFAKKYLSRANQLSQTAVMPELPGGASRVEGFTPDQLAAFGLIQDRALNGDQTINAASQGLGQFLDPNAAFSPLANQLVNTNRQGTIDAFNTQVAPGLSDIARRSGSFGNSGVAELDAIQRYGLSRSLQEGEAGIRNQFLDRSLAAQSYAPGLAASRQSDIQALYGIGQQQQGLGQAIRDIDFQNILAAREEPFTRLNVLGSAINTASGGYGRTTGTAPVAGGNPFLGGLGVAGTFLGGLGTLAAAFSSKEFKEDDAPADSILDGIKKLPVRAWRYKESMGLGTDKHVGPYAEDFHDIFGLGDGKTIPYVDGMGIGLAGLKEVAERLSSLEGRLSARSPAA